MSNSRSGGLLIQLLPRNSEEEQRRVDEDSMATFNHADRDTKSRRVNVLYPQTKFYTVYTMKKKFVYLKLKP